MLLLLLSLYRKMYQQARIVSSAPLKVLWKWGGVAHWHQHWITVHQAVLHPKKWHVAKGGAATLHLRFPEHTMFRAVFCEPGGAGSMLRFRDRDRAHSTRHVCRVSDGVSPVCLRPATQCLDVTRATAVTLVATSWCTPTT